MGKIKSYGQIGRFRSGIYGDMRTFLRNGELQTRAVDSRVNNPQTALQMAKRLTWSNLIALYRVMKYDLREGWQNVPQHCSLFNEYIRVNAKARPYALTKSDFKAGATIVAPYQITSGSLPAITAANGVSDIALGSFQPTASATIGQFADAIINNNPDFEYGDKLIFFVFKQYTKKGIPSVDFSHEEIILAKDSADTLDNLLFAGFNNINGYLGMTSVPVGGYCFIHTRRDTENGLLVSPQTIVCNNDNYIRKYTSVDACVAAAESYGARLADLRTLEVKTARQIEALAYFGIKATLASATETKHSIVLSDLTLNDKVYFDGDPTFTLVNADNIVLQGTGFAMLDADTKKITINGVDVTTATIDGNSMTITIPSTLAGQPLTSIIVSDATNRATFSLEKD